MGELWEWDQTLWLCPGPVATGSPAAEIPSLLTFFNVRALGL